MVRFSAAGVSADPIPGRTLGLLGLGSVAGAVLVFVATHVIEVTEVHPKRYEEADFEKLLLVLGVLTVRSFPEGVAVGVAFADLGLAVGVSVMAPLLFV